jgi:hypothetical protein
MASRSVAQIIATVQRRTGGKISPGVIYEALSDANKRIHRLYKWPWLYNETLIQLQPSYSTGTISVTDGLTGLTGTGTNWNTNWKYKRVYFGSNTDYQISQFVSPTSAILNIAPSTGQNWVNVPYTIYQDTYAVPGDCEPGSHVAFVNPKIRYRLLKLARYALENRAVALGTLFSNFQDSYSDAGFDDANSAYLIRVSPPPSAQVEFKLIYRRRVLDINLLTQTMLVPESFDEALALMTEYLVKRPDGIAGWMEAKQEAYQIVKNMRQQVLTETNDVFQMYGSWPYADNTSMYGNGVVINPPQGGY